MTGMCPGTRRSGWEMRNRLVGMALVAAGGAGLVACSSKDKPHEAAPETLTYVSTIRPLVEDKCGSCHRAGGIAPFALSTFDEVKSVAVTAREKIERREMPPWGPFSDPSCVVSYAFKNDLSLTDEQIGLFGRWVDLGLPRGALDSDAPPDPHMEPSPMGLVGKTDSIESGSGYLVAASAPDDLRCFPIDPGFTDDVWVTESMVVPGDPKVVHHALVYVDEAHEGMPQAGPDGSYRCFGGPELARNSLLLAWSPGGTSTVYGEGAALKIPKGAHLVTQVHFHPIATEASGKMTVELKRQPTPPAHVAMFTLVGNAASADDVVRLLPGPNDPKKGPAFFIPPDVAGHTETMEFVMPTGNLRLTAIGAHMHWAGVAMSVEVERKQGRAPNAECLLSTKYDFNWQRTFAYDAPMASLPLLRGGDRLRIRCTYDNTMQNPRIARAMGELRRNAPMEIRLGGESTDEMCQAILVFVE